MPAFVKTKEDERLWSKAKARAKEEGQEGNWAYVTGIYKKMKGGKVGKMKPDYEKSGQDSKRATTQKSVLHPTVDTFAQSSKARWLVLYPSGKMMETVAERLPGGWNTWMVASGKPMPARTKKRLMTDAEMLRLFVGGGPFTPGQSLTVEPMAKPLFPVEQVTSFLKKLKTRTGGRMRDVDFYPRAGDPTWSAEPAYRQRLDHFGNEGEGWDEDGWEEAYAGPLRQEVQAKLDREFGSGVLEVEVGEKGFVDVYLGNQVKTKFAGAVGPYEDSEINGVKVTQVQTDNRRSKASIRGNKLLISWGMDAPVGSPIRMKYLPKWVNWAKKKLGQKAERVEMKKEWNRTVVDGYSVYDLENKEQVAAILAKIQRDVQPILREFGLKFTSLKESVAEGSLGFNRGARIIALNVRQKRNPMLLRKYSAIMATMIHELAHLRHMNHGRQFQEFEVELMKWARDKRIYSPGRAAKVALRHLLKTGDLQAAEALYGFMGWLTSRDEVSGPFSSTHDAAQAAELVDAFSKSQGLSDPRNDFSDRLQPYPKAGAEVGTDSAMIFALAPEQIMNLIEEGEFQEAWRNHDFDGAEELVRLHGGAVFYTGADGAWDLTIRQWQGYPPAIRELGMYPYDVQTEYTQSKQGAEKGIPEAVKKELHDLLKQYNGGLVPDSKVHAIAEKAGVPTDDVESYVYSLASAHVSEKGAAEWKDKIPGGKADKKKPSDFDPEAVTKGIKVELEHTDDPELAKEIVLDHLTEFEDYYDALDKMEKELEKKAGDFWS